MPVPFQIFEDMPGYKTGANSFEVSYNIIGADGMNYSAVRAALLGFVPPVNSPPTTSFQWPIRGFSLEEVGQGVWKGRVTWAVLTNQYTLELGGQQQQIRCDITLTNIYTDPAQTASSPGYMAGDNGRPIGWDGRSVHGTSIYVPLRSWTETVEIPMSDYTFDYEDKIESIMLTPVNDAAFRGYAPGEVLFKGGNVQVSPENPDKMTATFKFDHQWNNSTANDNLITIDSISNIAKDGWDYLDVHYQQQVPSSQSTVIPKAAFVLIHRVYKRGDFSDLNIGTDENLPVWQG